MSRYISLYASLYVLPLMLLLIARPPPRLTRGVGGGCGYVRATSSRLCVAAGLGTERCGPVRVRSSPVRPASPIVPYRGATALDGR
ncbi:hypothetical protein GCM10027091_72260 [Streptomyces daliensis]